MGRNSIKNGVILTGGTGSRLAPMTNTINKHLLNINGKFIIDYPLDTLKKIGIENLTVILGATHFEQIVEYLQDGKHLGFNINYIFQKEPLGIAHAINLCKRYLLDDDNFVAILGDNLYQYPISNRITNGKAKVVLNSHPELKRFGVATLDLSNRISKIEEKPQIIDLDKRNYAITGCYFLNHDFFSYFEKLRPSARGEYEICEILQYYLDDNKLTYSKTEGWWHDAGTPFAIEEANFLLQTKIKKICRWCNVEKPLEDFYLTDGKPATYCKECDKKRRNEDYYENHDKELEKKSIYYANNKDKVIKSNNESSKKRRKIDPNFVLRTSVSTAIWFGLNKNNSSKEGESCSDYLPYSIDELKQHLEKQFEPWMTWENRGRYIKEEWDDNDPSTWFWQIDHVIPQSDLPYTSMEDENFKKCWALENLRPLSAKQNHLDGTKRTRHQK